MTIEQLITMLDNTCAKANISRLEHWDCQQAVAMLKEKCTELEKQNESLKKFAEEITEKKAFEPKTGENKPKLEEVKAGK